MIYIVGGNGFVGSAYGRWAEQHGVRYALITRENMAEFSGSTCDILIDANGNSRKYLAHRDPLADFELSVQAAAKRLYSISARKYIFLSSGDVYPDQRGPEVTREDSQLDVALMSRYGLHKFIAERLVIGTQRDWLIVRMGGFVGPHLKKNAIFDILTGAPVWLDPRSQLQLIRTDTAARLVMNIVTRGVCNQIINLSGCGVVDIGQLHRRLNSKSVFKEGAPIIRYELSLERLKNLCREEIPESNFELDAFLSSMPASGALTL